MQQHEIVAAVFRPRGLVVAGVSRLVLAERLGKDAHRVHAQFGQRLARRQRAAFAERAVVFLRAALVAIALDEQLSSWDRRLSACATDCRLARSLSRMTALS